MAEGNRLGRLEVGKSRHDGGDVLLRLGDQRRLETARVFIERIDRITHPKPGSRSLPGRFASARCADVRRLADELGEAVLDVHVHVFERAAEGEPPLTRFLQYLVEPRDDGVAVGLRYDPLSSEHRGVGFRCGDILLD